MPTRATTGRAGTARARRRTIGQRAHFRARPRARCGTRAGKRGAGRRWVRGVTTVSTYPPRGIFNRDAATIARSLASRRVSPKGVGSGLRMLLFYINRGGRGLSAARRAELQKAKRLMQTMLARRKAHGAARAR